MASVVEDCPRHALPRAGGQLDAEEARLRRGPGKTIFRIHLPGILKDPFIALN